MERGKHPSPAHVTLSASTSRRRLSDDSAVAGRQRTATRRRVFSMVAGRRVARSFADPIVISVLTRRMIPPLKLGRGTTILT